MELTDILLLLVLLSPILVGAIAAFGRSEALVGYAEGASDWFASKDLTLAHNHAFWRKYILRWVLWPFKKLGDLTAGIGDRFWKSGARILAYGCFALLLLFVAAALTYLAILIAVTVFVVAVIFKMLVDNSDSDSNTAATATSARVSTAYREDDRDVQHDDGAMPSVGVRGHTIFSGTSWLNEELQGRVDKDGNLYKGTNWLDEERIGRIDDEGDIYSGTSWTNEVKVGRIDEDGTLYKGSNWFTEEKTGRIAADGTIHKGTNWLNEQKTGRTGD